VTLRDLADGRLAAGLAAAAMVGAVLIAGPYPKTTAVAPSPPPEPVPNGTLPPTFAPPAEATPTPDPFAETAERCGAGRWAVRTLGDDQLSRLGFSKVVTARVADLAGVRRPVSTLPNDGRVGPMETTLFSITARLLQDRVTPEGEVQLAIADPTGSATMVVVMPDADCLARTPATLKTRVVEARDALVKACGPIPSGWAPVAGTARIVGPGYWAAIDPDQPASNGLQLSAPVSVTVTGTCRSGGTASPSPSAPGTPA
jgi:hypothetical protein